jgi:hypothetical protein
MPEELNDGRVYVRKTDWTFECIGVDTLVKSQDAIKQVGNIDILVAAKENQTQKAIQH